jgi:D-glycero-D-manno-heptose 1,7-bisphosphate phosphatase
VRPRWRPWDGAGPLAFELAPVVEQARVQQIAFLDRDGVLDHGVPDPDSGMPESPLTVRDVRLLDGAAQAASTLAAGGFALVCVSNQPAAAKGKTTLQELMAVHERVVELLAGEGVELLVSLLCPHHPQGTVAGLSGPCACRKPAPGMLVQAAREQSVALSRCWMLGDTDSDVLAGRAAGARTVLISYPASAHKRSGTVSAELSAATIGDGVAQLLDHEAR